MIQLHLIKRAQDSQNRLSHLREKDVSLIEVDPKITFPVISPEPNVAAMVYLILIYSHTVAFRLSLQNRKSPPLSIYTHSMPL